jgi:hypothetical protein
MNTRKSEWSKSPLKVAIERGDGRGIGGMSQDEILQYFEEAIEGGYTTTVNFIITFIKITDKHSKIQQKYPEYFI